MKNQNKVYGYKEKDYLGLIRFINENSKNSLTENFVLYADKIGKKYGTVRNMYYSTVKFSEENGDFCDKYLDGVALVRKKITEFTPCQERTLIRNVLRAKSEGKSVRSAVSELAGGDMSLALRFQNKYRNVLKNNPDLIRELKCEMGVNESESERYKTTERVRKIVGDYTMKKLMSEIDKLINGVRESAKQDNVKLKERVNKLESENAKLYSMLIKSDVGSAEKYLTRLGLKKGVIN